jgi:hypothetical protein
MTSRKSRFAAAINCIDGRVQEPVSRWLRGWFNVDYVDTITEPGADKALLESAERVESIRRRVMVSVTVHNSCGITIVGHHECAGNPVSKEEHLEAIKRCVEVIASWELPVPTVGLWVNEQWAVEVVCGGDSSRHLA